MLFTSLEFVLFVGLVILLYYIVPKKMQWCLLLVANIWFYLNAGIWGLVFMAVTILATYTAARLISASQERVKTYIDEHKDSLTKEDKKLKKQIAKRNQRIILIVSLLVSVGILAVLKYTNFVIDNFTHFDRVDMILPLGISFYTFQAVGYLIDVYRGVFKAENNILKFALFVSFFPQLIQGPISRWKDLSDDLLKTKSFDARTVELGLYRVLWGYFKKLVIADRAAIGVAAISGDVTSFQGVFALLGMMLYSVQLYSDFTGGIDITIGIAQMLGIHVKENFNRPFFSKSIEEYWRRWHISMGTWFKDYIFYPISMAKGVTKASKWMKSKISVRIGQRFPIYLSTVITWFLTGLWHGASWNYIVWGMLNCVIIITSQELKPLYETAEKKLGYRRFKYYKVFEIVRTLFILGSLQMLDHYKDIGTAFYAYGTIFTAGNFGQLFTEKVWETGLIPADMVVIAIGVIVMLAVSLKGRSERVSDVLIRQRFVIRAAVAVVAVIVIVVFGVYGIGYEASNFIYNQF